MKQTIRRFFSQLYNSREAFIQSRRLFFLPRLGAERIGERPRPSLRVAEEPIHKQNTRAVSLIAISPIREINSNSPFQRRTEHLVNDAERHL